MLATLIIAAVVIVVASAIAVVNLATRTPAARADAVGELQRPPEPEPNAGRCAGRIHRLLRDSSE